MKPQHFLLLPSVFCLVSILFASCGDKSPVAPDRTPEWLTALIRTLESQPVASPPLSITRYEYKGEVVYFVPPRCCDIWSDLYRVDGGLLCHANGGATGGGDRRCPDFFSERKNGQIVWQDPRSAR